MADNNYCACNSGESKYTIKLNQQGPAGKKGEQGDKGIPGFSPYISVVQSDDENYILRINNEANSYNTPNLFPKDQVTTWTNNIEAQVQQNTADLSKVNNNFVTLKTNQEIGGYKTFTENLNIGTIEKRGFKYTTILLKTNLYNSTSGIVFHNPNGNSEKPDTFLSYHKDVGICYYKNQYDGNISAGDLNELAVKGDLPTIAKYQTPGLVKSDFKTITISDDGALTANYLVPQTYTNTSGEEVNKFLKLTINKNSLQSSGFSSNDLILTYRTTTFDNGEQVSDITSEYPITTFLKATVDKLGTVKPDGTTVTINADGIISAVGEVSQQELADGLALKVNLTDYNNRVGSLESTVGEQAQTIATLQENNTRLLEMINALKDRVTALETMIDGGNA